MESDKLRWLIAEDDKEIRRLERELLDVLTEVGTPDNSDEEGDDVEDRMEGVKNVLLMVEAIPQRETAYSALYNNERYCKKSEKKVRLMKNVIKKVQLSDVFSHPNFVAQLRNIERIYPDDGGRNYINTLVACYEVMKPE